MRNLKRAFSLVLALVMVMSMISIAPAVAADETAPATVTSNFSDAAEINYTEAVAITGGIGLFAGADGKFMPKGTVTRAQMATIIVKMLYGGDVNADSFKGNGKFSDTASFEGGWAEGYINWCSTLGIVAGYGDGTFRPGNQVTTAEAATMILNALKIDAGEGTWPNTVMAKASEEDLFEDLKPMPATNTALSREELAVIALNGLNWTSTEETGWYVSGGTADGKMTFESYKDAQTYATKTDGQVQALAGRDSLANKVYDLKKATGYITANQATGEKYTEVTVNFGSEPLKFNVATDATMIGHKVEVWYEDLYTSEREPGKTYAVSEAAEYITLTEAAEGTKEYKAAFGVKYEYDANTLTITDDKAYVTGNGNIDGYTPGEAAPAGTYVIDIETGALCAYIAPASYTIAKVGYVNATAGQETISIGVNTWNNNEDEDEVVEYAGIAKDDYVAYTQLQDMYVVVKLDAVSGRVSKVGEKDGKIVVTIDGKQYTEGTVAGTIAGTMTAATLADPDYRLDYQQDFVFYLDPYGNFVCFEAAEGAGFDMANTFFVLGVMQRTESGSYGKKSIQFLARGIDMTGNEALIPIGVQKDFADETSLVGEKTIPAENTYYTVEDTKDKDAKELGLKVVKQFPNVWNDDDPYATMAVVYSNGGPVSTWGPGKEFEYGVNYVFTNNCSMSYKDSNNVTRSFYATNSKATKYILVEGTKDQDYALETSVHTGTMTLNIAAALPMHSLITRTPAGTYNLEAAVFMTNIDHGLNATMIYVPRQSSVEGGKIVWSNMVPDGSTENGNTYTVYNATTGAAMEITLDSSIDSIEPGFYSVGYDSDEELYKLAVDADGKPIKMRESTYAQLKTNDYSDGRKNESALYDQKLLTYTGAAFTFESMGGASTFTCSGAKVIDVRSDEAIAASGVAKITSLDQVWALKETATWIDFELDIAFNNAAKALAVYVEVFNNAAYGMNTVVYGEAGDDTVTVISGDMHAAGATIELPVGMTVENTGFFTLVTGGNGSVSLAPKNLGGDVAYVIDGDVSGIGSYDVLVNVSGDAGLNKVADFGDYDAVQYRTWTNGGKTTLIVLASADKGESFNTFDAPVESGDFDLAADIDGAGMTATAFLNKQKTKVMSVDTYDLNGETLYVVAGETELNEVAVATLADAAEIPTEGLTIRDNEFGIESIADLNAKLVVAEGATWAENDISITWFTINGDTQLIINSCTEAPAPLTVTEGTLAGNYRLAGDVELTAPIKVAKNTSLTVDLNGKTLSGTIGTFFDVEGTLTITDTTGTAGDKWTETTGGKGQVKYTGTGNVATGANDGMLYPHNANAVINIEAGTFSGRKTAGRGGISRLYTGTINMNGGMMINNTTAYQGGVIYVGGNGAKDVATFNMTNGVIANNKAANGGAIAIGNGGTNTVNITGGVIRDNSAAGGKGGAFYLVTGAAKSSLTIENATISGNDAKMGGAIYMEKDTEVTLDTGAVITDHTTTHWGGAVYNEGGTFVMKDGEISGNTGTGYGGAIFVGSGKADITPVVTIKGGIITDNHATSRGGAIASTDGSSYATINIEGGEITGNTTAGRGATLFTQMTTKLNISGGTIGYGEINGAKPTGKSGSEDCWIRGTAVTVTGNPVVDTMSLGDTNCTLSVTKLTKGANIIDADGRITATIDGTVTKTGTTYTFKG